MLLFLSCRKDQTADNCLNLKKGLTTNNTEVVKSAINSIINGYTNGNYNEANIKILQRTLTDCGVVAESFCFNCIKTNPSQTELIIKLDNGGTLISKTVDITYTEANSMICNGMHD